jgi:Predicted RNA-binding protein homologous to eukaryotic snRNP
MPFDGLFAAAVRRQLADALVGARIDKIYQPMPHTVILHCWRPGEHRRLLLSADPNFPRVHLTRSDPPNPLQAPLFCMVLRKHLDPGKIVAVEQVGFDRVLHIVVDGYDENGKPARRRLIAELTGRNSNLVLVDEANLIIDALRRAPSDVNSYRAVWPGEPYVAPPATGKLDPRSATAEALVQRAAALTASTSWERFLSGAVEGVSPFAAAHVVAAAGLPPNAPVVPEERSMAAVAAQLAELVRAAEAGAFSPAVVLDEAGCPADFWAWRPAHVAPDKLRPAPDPCGAADAYYEHKTAVAAREQLRARLAQAVRAALKRLQRKAEALKEDLAAAEQAEQYRLFGELLTASLHMVKQGPEATVPNYYEGGAPITIPMDPALTPAANAQKYFKRYNKAKTAQTAVKAQLDAVNADMAYLEQALLHIELAPGTPELEELEAELQAAGVLPAAPPRRRTAAGQAAPSRPAPRPARRPPARCRCARRTARSSSSAAATGRMTASRCTRPGPTTFGCTSRICPVPTSS